MNFPVKAGFEERLAGYLAGVKAKVEENYKQYASLKAPEVIIERGQRYVRVVKAEKGSDGKWISRSVHSFVDVTNGDVLKAAGYKAPAKHARGNVFNDDFGLGNVDWHGPAYLR